MRKKSSYLDAMLVLFIPAVIVLMVAALWWTRDLSRTVHTTIFLGSFLAVMAAGTWSDVRRENRKDEIQVAAIRFGHRWSSVPVGLLLISAAQLAPVQELIADLYRSFEDAARGGPPPAAKLFIFGSAATILLQLLAASLLRAAWLHSKARP